MSSTILHEAGGPEAGPASGGGAELPPKNPFLVALGERTRALRARRGMTRKAVAVAAGVSERHLANLEYGEGNASILVLLQVAGALQCALAELIGDVTTLSPEWLLIRDLLGQQDEAALRRVRVGLAAMLGGGHGAVSQASARVALIGLRGVEQQRLQPVVTPALRGLCHQFRACDARKCHAVALKQLPFCGKHAVKLFHLRAAQGRIQVGQAIVVADLVVPVFPGVRYLGRRRQMLGMACKPLVVGQDCSAAARSNSFVAIETQGAHPSEGACMPPVVIATERFGGIFNQCQTEIMRHRQQRIHVGRMTEGVHGHEGSNDFSGVAVDALAGALFGAATELGSQACGVYA